MKPILITVAAIAVPILAGCAGTSGSSGSLLLQPGGRVHGEVHLPAGSATTLKLANDGPGRVDFVVREDGGNVLADGPLGESKMTVESSDPVVLIVVVEAYPDLTANVRWFVISEDGAAVRWEIDGKPAGVLTN